MPITLHNKTLPSLILCAILLGGCASSNVSRDTSRSIDQGVQHTKDMFSDQGSGDTAFQNTNQETKGALLGGAAGTVTGMTTSVGAFPGLIVGAVLGASYGRYIDTNTTLRDQLLNRGANVIVLGDQVRIIIPSGRLFNYRSATIDPAADSTFALLARYINQFNKTLITVAAYTDESSPPRAALALSNDQAKIVAKRLIVYGLNARLLYAKGYGDIQPVDPRGTGWNDGDNDRIEITFEKLV
jgi:outer membrane protein OmpA-like peptidoglycan-associated protein